MTLSTLLTIAQAIGITVIVLGVLYGMGWLAEGLRAVRLRFWR